MPSTQSRGEPIIPFDLELKWTLRRMNDQYNPTILGDGINHHLPPPVNFHNQDIVENLGDSYLRWQPPVPRPQEFYRENISCPTSSTKGSYIRGN